MSSCSKGMAVAKVMDVAELIDVAKVKIVANVIHINDKAMALT